MHCVVAVEHLPKSRNELLLLEEALLVLLLLGAFGIGSK
jgi:hypothetical protein